MTIYQAGTNVLLFLSLLEGLQDYISDLLDGRVHTGSRGGSSLVGPQPGTHPGIWTHLLKLKSAQKLSTIATENSSHFIRS